MRSAHSPLVLAGRALRLGLCGLTVTAGLVCGLASAAQATVAGRDLPQATASGPGPVLTAEPASVDLGVAERAPVLLTLTAPASAPLRGISLRLFHDGSVKVRVARAFPAMVPAGGGRVAVIKLCGGAQGSISGSLTAVVSARAGSAPAAPRTVVTVSVPVTERSATLSPLGHMTIPAAPAAIDDQHSGVIIARIADVTTVPIVVQALHPVTAESANSLKITPVTPKKPGVPKKPGTRDGSFTLQPGASRNVAFSVQTAPGFRSGAYVISFQATASTTDGTRQQTLSADRSITVSVFGEQQITSAVGAVSFLFVPGLLILVVIKLLWEQVTPRRPVPWVNLRQPQFWAGAITLSLAAIPIYFIITEQFGTGHNLISSFDSGDILRLWLGSLAVGVLGYLACLRAWTWRRIRPGNDARKVLKKLRRRGSLEMGLASVTGWSGRFGLGDSFGDKVTVVPMITYKSGSPELRGDLDRAANTDDAKQFWDQIKSGGKGKDPEFAFEANRTVVEVPAAKFTDLDTRNRIVIAG